MKKIDLLNKIANNEELPKKIKYNGYEWFFCKEFKDYKKEYDEYTEWLFEEYGLINCLNDEIEIIEENKPIEKLTIWYSCEDTFDDSKKYIDFNNTQYFNKINEIIDRLNELEKEGNK